MPDTTNDIDMLLSYLSSAAENFHTKTPVGITAAFFYGAVFALRAERDALREQLRLANIDQFNTEAEANDRDRELRKDLICAALAGTCTHKAWRSHDAMATEVVAVADATLAAMRKGEA